ncbi:MAG: S1C family serine protease [Oscillospiraceae bacterium]
MRYHSSKKSIYETNNDAVPSSGKRHSGVFGISAAAVLTAAVFFVSLMDGCLKSEAEIVTSYTERNAEICEYEPNGTAAAAQAFEIWKKRTLTVPEIVKKVKPSVVGIISEFPDGTKCSGTGIIISENGNIVTNAHVIQNICEKNVVCAENVKAVLFDESEYSAQIIGADTPSDLAVIKIDAGNVRLSPAELGDSNSLVEGETAVAIGNPLGLELYGSTTCGIISALGRTITVSGYEMTLIQTDAAINPGNSGGPLLNCRGEVIGINSSKIISDNAEGLGFAIPISDAKPIIGRLLKN